MLAIAIGSSFDASITGDEIDSAVQLPNFKCMHLSCAVLNILYPCDPDEYCLSKDMDVVFWLDNSGNKER